MSSFSETLANFNKRQEQRQDQEQSEGLLSSFTNRASQSLSSLMETNPDKDCLGLSTFQRYIGFFLLLGSSFLFFMISLFQLPLVLFHPSKFALSWTLGSLLFLLSFTVMNGWKAHVKHLVSSERVYFTTAYVLSMVMTLYFSVVKPMYVPVILFIVVQVIALGWYLASYLPGGTTGLKYISRSILPL